MNTSIFSSTVFSLLLLTFFKAPPSAEAATAQFIGHEYQAGSDSGVGVAGTIRLGDPAADPAFTAWLATAGLTAANIATGVTPGGGPAAVWGQVTTAATASTTSLSFHIGGTSVTASIAGWSDTLNAPAPSGSATLTTAGLDAGYLQSGSPRPGFASGQGSGYYIGTAGGNTSDTIRNAVSFDLSGFDGGGVFAFGIFGGDLETGAPGSPLGFLQITFVDDSTEIIPYLPDPALFPEAVWDGNNNISETYGNETSRFIGLASDTLRIKSALFVVGDDDLNSSGSSEHLSFIAGGMTFLDADGRPFVPARLPEPSAALLGCAGLAAALCRRKRETAETA